MNANKNAYQNHIHIKVVYHWAPDVILFESKTISLSLEHPYLKSKTNSRTFKQNDIRYSCPFIGKLIHKRYSNIWNEKRLMNLSEAIH